jgi:hypothetical protein
VQNRCENSDENDMSYKTKKKFDQKKREKQEKLKNSYRQQYLLLMLITEPRAIGHRAKSITTNRH